MSYRCNACSALFRQPGDSAPQLDQTTVYCGVREAHYLCEDACPLCGSTNIETISLCECGCGRERDIDDDYHSSCVIRIDAEERAYELSQLRKTA